MGAGNTVNLPGPPPGFTEAPMPNPPAGFSEVPGGAPGAMSGAAGPQMPQELAGTAPRTNLDIFDLLTGAMPGKQGVPPVIPPEHQKMYEAIQKMRGNAQSLAAAEAMGAAGGGVLGAVASRLRNARQLAESPILELGPESRILSPQKMTPEYLAEIQKQAAGLDSPIAQLQAQLQKLSGAKEKLPGLENERQIAMQQLKQKLDQMVSQQKSLQSAASQQPQASGGGEKVMQLLLRHYLPTAGAGGALAYLVQRLLSQH